MINNKLSYYQHRRRGCVALAQWFKKYTLEQDNPLLLKIYHLIPRLYKCKTSISILCHKKDHDGDNCLTRYAPYPSLQTTATNTLVQTMHSKLNPTHRPLPIQPNHSHQHIGTKNAFPTKPCSPSLIPPTKPQPTQWYKPSNTFKW